MARAEHGPRRLHQGAREHPRAPEPLVAQGVRRAAWSATARSRRSAPRSRGPCCSSERERAEGGQPLRPARESSDLHRTLDERRGSARATEPARRSSRSGSRRPASSPSRTSRSRRYALDDVDYKAISLLWSVLFVIVSVIYRPIEQLLSRTIADRRARGRETGHPLRTPLLIQAGFALAFLVVALAFAGRSRTTCSTVGGAVLGARRRRAGLRRELLRARLAGRAPVVRALRRAGVHGGHLAAAVRGRGRGRHRVRAVGRGDGHGRGAVRVARRGPVGVLAPPEGDRAQEGATRRRSASPAAGASRSPCCASWSPSRRCSTAACWPPTSTATDAAVAGYVFTALLIARAPLQLFQAVQGSLLPHLAGLEATAGPRGVRARDPDHDPRHRGLRRRGRARPAGGRPVRDDLLFDDDATYGRLGLAAVALGMGAHLAAGTLNQAALARDHAGAAAAAWLFSAAVFVAWMLLGVVERRADARRGGLPRRGVVAVRAAGRRLPPAGRVTRGGRLSGRRGERSTSTRPEPLTMPGVTQRL